jgi:WhiB family redox-sensing transcriptional regulator
MNQIASLMDMVIIPETWIADALCAQVGGDDHFPAKTDTEAARRALKVCRRCEVAEQCLQYALQHNETRGVWGGKSAQQRRRMRREP